MRDEGGKPYGALATSAEKLTKGKARYQ